MIGGVLIDNFALGNSLMDDSIYKPHRASYWEPLTGNKVNCILCPNNCIIENNITGLCRTRSNKDGVLNTLVYSRACEISLDVVEKSPLFHYQVDGNVFSIATASCNLTCKFCQNWEISQASPDKVKSFYLTPKDVIDRAKKNNINSINFFYTEPVIYYEYMLDIAKLAKKENMKTFCITAGYVNPDPLIELIPFIDAFTVGMKGFSESFYKSNVGCSIDNIKNTIVLLAKHKDKTWFEISNLLIGGYNDDKDSIISLSKWISSELGNDVPLHLLRFEPAYKMMDIPATSISAIDDAYNTIKDSGLNYVYVGNIPGHKGNNTYCPKCGKLVIERVDYKVINNSLVNGKCSCGNEISGHWLKK